MSPKAIFRLALLLLVGTFMLSLVLAHQAAEAARRHRDVAVAALRDYATFAAWEAANHARTEISAVHYGAFLSVIGFLRERPTAWQDRPWLEQLVRGQRNVCECTDGIRFFFTMEPDGTFDADADDERTAVWVRDTLRHVVHAARAIGPSPPAVVRTIAGGPRRLAVLITNSVLGSLYGHPGSSPTVVVYLIARDSTGTVARVYGFVSEPRVFAGPIFARVLEHQQLLPPAIIGGVRRDSLIALSVADPSGVLLYRSREPFPASFAARNTLTPSQGALTLRLTLNPVLADRLVGGVPPSRLPVLVGVLVLSAGMIVIVWVMLRRQQALVGLRDDFVANVSHELRTPLAQIRLLAELLHRGRPLSEETRRRSARVIDQEARRLSLLVENVLGVARSARGGTRIAPVATELSSEVREITSAFEPLLHASDSTVCVRAVAPVVAAVDPAALRQILLNLHDNANRYGPAKQSITVGVRQVEGWAELSVEDQGPGVPSDEARRIFEPYHRLARDASGADGGTGIGLAVVRELVIQHGGRLWVERAAGGGARFVVQLPTSSAAAASAVVAASA